MTDTVDFQIIANLMAGKGDGRKRLSDLELFLKNHNRTYAVLTIDKPTPISRLPNHHPIKEGLICIGGDGTVSESMGYLLNNNLDLPLAIIPTGTANIIANSFGILSHGLNFGFLSDIRYKKVDVGVAEYGDEKDYFLLGFGLGFEEKFLKMTKDRFKTKLGIFSYIFFAIAELAALKKIPIIIRTKDKQVKANVCTLMVLNLPPKILKIFPLFKFTSVVDNDGLLALKYVESKNYFQAFLGTLALHIFGRVNFGLVKTLVDSNFCLESSEPLSTQVDGELKGNLPVKISLLSSKLSLLI